MEIAGTALKHSVNFNELPLKDQMFSLSVLKYCK